MTGRWPRRWPAPARTSRSSPAASPTARCRAAEGYAVDERFYRRAGRVGAAGSRAGSRPSSPSTCPTCCAYRARGAPRPTSCTSSGSPSSRSTSSSCPARARLVLTAHDVLPREPRAGPAARPAPPLRARRRTSSCTPSTAARRLTGELGLDPARVTVIPHGALHPLAGARRAPAARAARPPPGTPVVALSGLLRPYKGIDVLLDAWRRFGTDPPGELWIVGMPRMDAAGARRCAARRAPRAALRRPTPSSPASCAAPTSSCCPTARSTSPASSSPRSALGRPLLLSDVGGFAEVAATGAAELVAARRPGRAARRARALLADPEPPRAPRAASRAHAARRRTAWDAIAQRHLALYEHAAARVTTARSRPRLRAAAHCSALGAGRATACRLGAGALRGAARCRRPSAARSADAALPDRLAHRRRPRRARRHRRQGRQRARARLPARPARGRRRLRRLAPTGRRRPRAPPAPTSSSTSRAAARSAPRTPRCARRAADIVAFSDANALWEPDALRALVAPFATTRGSATSAAASRSSTPTAAPTRRASTGATRCSCARRESRPGERHRRQRRDLRDAAARPTSRSTPSWATTSSSPSRMVRDGWRCVDAAAGARDRADGPRRRGRGGPQAADDEPRLGDRPARRPARPARLAGRVRHDDRSATAGCATSAPFLHLVALGHARRARRAPPRSSSCALLAAAFAPRPRAAAARSRKLLHPDPGLDRAGPRRPPAPRHRRPAGTPPEGTR